MISGRSHRQTHSLFNCLYLLFAAGSLCLMVAPAWNYGFFFTPFPAILTGLFLLCVTGATICAIDVFAPVSWLGLGVTKLTQMSTLRWLLLAIPVPVCAYLLLHSQVAAPQQLTEETVSKARLLIQIDNVLFGHKRAEGWMVGLAQQAMREGKLKIADEFLTAKVASFIKHCNDKRRIAAVLTELFQFHMQTGLFHEASSDLQELVSYEIIDPIILNVPISALGCANQCSDPAVPAQKFRFVLHNRPKR